MNRSSDLGNKYIPQLGPEASTALMALQKQFGPSSNPLLKVRNSFSFHFEKKDDEVIEVGFRAAAADAEFDDVWCAYNSGTNWGTYIAASEISAIHAMLKAVGKKTDIKAARERIPNETLSASKNLITLIDNIMENQAAQYFGDDATVTAEEAPKPMRLSQVYLSFVVEFDK